MIQHLCKPLDPIVYGFASEGSPLGLQALLRCCCYFSNQGYLNSKSI